MYLALSGVLFSTFPIFVLRTVVVTKLLVGGILLSNSLIFVLILIFVNHLYPVFFYQHLQFFSLHFVYLCCFDLCQLKYLHQDFSFLHYLPLSLKELRNCNRKIIFVSDKKQLIPLITKTSNIFKTIEIWTNKLSENVYYISLLHQIAIFLLIWLCM